MKDNSPKVTVLMPVHNGERHLKEAIESILVQSYSDFEFLIINDGSTDKSVEIIKSFNDQRICLINNEKNIGLPLSLNKGIKLAKGQYIARMDCDDISHPDRLRRQVEFMNNHPEVGVCGTWVELWDGIRCRMKKYPITHEEILIAMLFDSAIAHPSTIIHKSKLQENNLYYDANFRIAQDYELWHRCSQYFQLANIPEVLLKYRISSTGHFYAHRELHLKTLSKIYEAIFLSLGIKVKKDEIKLHRSIVTLYCTSDLSFVLNTKKWLQKIRIFNLREKKYKDPQLSKALANRFFWVCYKGNKNGLKIWKTFWDSSLSRYNTIPIKNKIKFAFAVTINQLRSLFRIFFHSFYKRNFYNHIWK